VEPLVARLAAAWEQVGLRGKVFLVGGRVRDALLGRDSADLDFVVDGDALAAAEALWRAGISVGPPGVYPRFGTAAVSVEGRQIELASARAESYSPDSRKPDVRPATLLEDAQRRDFTVNALMQDPWTGEHIDLLGSGLADLRSQTLRTPLEPGQTFSDDPLRMLRAVRFKWQLGFEYAPGLVEALQERADRLDVVSAERIRDELSKLLVLPDADRALDEIVRFGLSARFWPELDQMVGVEQGGYHHLDVWGHTLAVVRASEPRLDLRLAALLHDVSKPETRSVEEGGRVRFLGHELRGAEVAVGMLRRLRFGVTLESKVGLLVRHHMRFTSMPSLSRPAARRLIHDLGDAWPDLVSLVEADLKGLKQGAGTVDAGAIRATLEAVAAESPPETLHSPLTGEEIMQALGVEPGPELGRIKARLTDAVLEGKIEPGDREAALSLLRELQDG
jgi:poly(A) polymerase